MYATANYHSAERNQKRSPFLRLPAELRNQIYGYAYQTATIEANRAFKAREYRYVKGDDGVTRELPQLRVFRKVPGLSLACRQIHQEAAPFSNIYTSLKIEGTAGIATLLSLLSRRRSYLHAVREIQPSEDLMIDILDWYTKYLYSRSIIWLKSYVEVFPALEVIVWKCNGRRSALGKHRNNLESPIFREAAARYCFDNSNLRLIYG